MKTYTDRENELMENLGVQKASNENSNNNNKNGKLHDNLNNFVFNQIYDDSEDDIEKDDNNIFQNNKNKIEEIVESNRDYLINESLISYLITRLTSNHLGLFDHDSFCNYMKILSLAPEVL